MKRRPSWMTGSLIAFAIPAMLVGFASLALAATPDAQQGGGHLPGDPTAGAQIYQTKCSQCHGSSLEGTVGPRLHPIEKLPDVDQPPYNGNPLDPQYLIDTIKKGKQGVGSCSQCSGQMPSWQDKLSETDISNVAAYIIQMNQQKGPIPLSEEELAHSNVEWVTIGVLAMLAFTYLLARYNMRWIARKQIRRRSR